MKLLDGELELITETIHTILKYNSATQENLIPILQQVQDKLGYLPPPAMQQVAQALKIPAVDVYSLATFYNQFRLNPPGDNQIKVCMGTACYMVGGLIAMESFERRLEIKEGDTTLDRRFSLERVACVGCCTMAPVVVVNETVEGHVTPTRVDGIMLTFENGESGLSPNGEHIKKQENSPTKENSVVKGDVVADRAPNPAERGEAHA